jgi:RNA 2',3'-cyclic 3'-phosphodiesterase
MRLFTAIDIPEEVKQRLKEFLEPLRALAKSNWSPTDHFHLTTKFIGEWPEQGLADIESTLTQVAPAGAIDIAVRGIGWFPNAAKPRVLWAAVEANASLAKLARVTEESVNVLGVAKETRAYSPHLTLARVREHVPLEALRRVLENTTPDFGTFRADSFFLYLSAGGKYTKLAEFPL